MGSYYRTFLITIVSRIRYFDRLWSHIKTLLMDKERCEGAFASLHYIYITPQVYVCTILWFNALILFIDAATSIVFTRDNIIIIVLFSVDSDDRFAAWQRPRWPPGFVRGLRSGDYLDDDRVPQHHLGDDQASRNASAMPSSAGISRCSTTRWAQCDGT